MNIFYKSEWFGNKKISSSFATLKLEDALARVKRINNLSWIALDKYSYVFVPFHATVNSNISNNLSDELLIGSLDEFGKYSKATLSGIVLDGKTNEPVPGVKINVDNPRMSTATDVNGNFSITLPVGEQLVHFSYLGYEDYARKIKMVSNGNANFLLFEKSIKIKEVVITAERAEFNVTGTQMSLLRLNAKAIREMPVSFGETDILKSMALLPGIQTAGEFGSGFNVRGGGTDQNLILIEDVPIFNPSHLFGLNSIINPDNVSSVTLLKGGIPAKYGERASSVMDIRLNKDLSDKIKAKGGIGLLNSRLSVQIPIFGNKANLIIGARSSYSNWLLHQVPNLDLMNSSASFYDMNALLAVNLNSKNKITVFGYYSNDKFAFNKITDYEYGNILGSLRWTHLFNTRFSSSLLMGYSQYNYRVNELDTSQRRNAYQINLRTRYNSLKWNFTWLPNDKHSIDFGINSILYGIMPGNKLPYGSESLIMPFSVQSQKGLEMAVYVSDNFDILPDLNAELGLRFVHYLSLGPGLELNFLPGLPRSLESISDSSHFGNNQLIHKYSGIEPRLAFRYNLNEVSSIKMSYTHIDQFINLISNNSVMAPTDTWTLSNANIKPLICNQFAIGYFRNFAQNSYEVSIESYYKALRNVIEYKNGAQILLNDHIETDLLNARGFGYGIELYLKKNTGVVTGWISYTFSRSWLQTSGSTPDQMINNNKYYPSNFDRPHNLVINSNYHISRRWRLSGTFMYNTGRPVTYPELRYSFNGHYLVYYSERNKYRLPDYNRLDLAITYDENLRLKKMWKGSWTLSVINVYARKNVYSVYYAQEDNRNFQNEGRTGLFMIYIIGIPLPTLTYNFTF